MPKSRQRAVIISAGFILLLSLGAFLNWQRPAQPFFNSPPGGLTLHALGNATNYLKFDHDRVWKAFSISNGTSKTLFYTVTEVEYETPGGWRSAGSWLSNTLTSVSLMTRHESAGEIPSGTTDVFYATLPPSNVPWRLRVGCFEANWSDPLDAAVGKLRAGVQGLPPPKSKSWSGARFELISERIVP